MQNDSLANLISKLRQIPPTEIWNLDENGHVTGVAMTITGEVADRLIIWDGTLNDQVTTISAEIMWWGRVLAQAQRVVASLERGLTRWKAQQYLALSVAPEGEESGWKKPSDKVIEATYRTAPAYEEQHVKLDRAVEAETTARMILDAFKAKRDMLKVDVFRRADGSLHRLSV